MLADILKQEEETGKEPEYVPKCNKKGMFEKQQCDNTGQLFN